MSITLYDIASTLPHQAFSPNTWKTRFSLNYKGLPYNTTWVELADVEGVCKQLGIAPTKKWPDGRPFYTLPAIHDPSTGVYISDSFAIAEYLEKTYPTPGRSLFPSNTIALQSLVEDALSTVALRSLWKVIVPDVPLYLSDESAQYWRRTREEITGVAYDNIAPKGQAEEAVWAASKAGWGTVDSLFTRSEGPFILGTTPSWADFVIGSWLLWIRLMWGEESVKWKEVASWHNGRWEKLLNDLKEYQKME